MAATIHANARTTPKIRAEIQAAPPSVSNAALARRFGVTKATVAKWRRRDQVHDGSHRPHRLNTTLTEAQEAVVVAVRELLLLPLDDLLVVAWEFLNPNLSRSALDRCLRRHGVNNLKAMLREQEGEAASNKPYKSFKDYEPGFVHVDIKYLPQMAGESARSYLFVAIDRATRWVYLEIRKDKSARSARAFLNKLIQAAPFKIQKILTDNDKAFTDRFSAAGERKPTGTHPFDVLCQAHGIEHRLIKPRRPQTNGMVERFNGRIAEILQTTRFDSSKDLKQTLLNYREVYNHHIPQRALGHVTPIQALKQWQQKRPEIFVKKVYNHAGLDSYAFSVFGPTGRIVFACWVEPDNLLPRPVPGVARPALRMLGLGLLVDCLAGCKDGRILSTVPLRRCDEPDGAVPVALVVPDDEALHPGPCQHRCYMASK